MLAVADEERTTAAIDGRAGGASPGKLGTSHVYKRSERMAAVIIMRKY